MKVSASFLLKFILSVIGSFILLAGFAQQNPSIKYKDYNRTFLANTYPKSITDQYRETNTISPELTDREVAILVNCEIELDNLIDYMMRDELFKNINKIPAGSFDRAKIKMLNYHKAQNVERTDGFIINRTQQWFADSIIQSQYGGRIYYDTRKMIVKPKEAYQRMILELIGKNEIIITDEFMKKSMLKMLSDEINNSPALSCDFFKIETWPANK